MSEWRRIEEHPVTMFNFESRPGKSLLYSKQLGVVIGTVFMWADRIEYTAQVPNFHGDAIADWGVTHFAVLPPPPEGT